MNRRERRLKQRVAEVTRRLIETDEERRIREQREWLERMAARRQEHRMAAAKDWGQQIDGIIYDCMTRQTK